MSSSDNQIVNGITLSTKDYTFAEPKANKSGGKSVNIQGIKSKGALVISTPLMLTWGVNEYVDDMTGKRTYDMSLQFPKKEYETDETTAFLEKLNDLQINIKQHVRTECKKLLNKGTVTEDVVDALFHPMLRYPKDQNTGEPDMSRPPTFRIKITFWDEKFDCEIYNMKQQPLFPNDDGVMPMDLIAKASNVATAIRCGGLWFANGKFGCTFRLVQAVVKPRANLKGRCFIQLSPDEEIRLEKQVDNDDVAVDEVVAEDSDDEVESTDPPEPPAPQEVKEVKAKKVVAKKKVVKRKPTVSAE